MNEHTKHIINFCKNAKVKLIAVTKYSSSQEIKKAIESGITSIGENKAQESIAKFEKLELNGIEKHFIGHLQTNKVKLVVKHFDVIQSVDSEKIAKEINKRAKEIDKVMPIFIEVNISGEEQKHGIPEEETEKFVEKVKKLNNVEVIGLMAIAPHVEKEKTRPYFKKMKQLFDKLDVQWLSMGMSNDYEVAIEEGANMVRIGSALFRAKEG